MVGTIFRVAKKDVFLVEVYEEAGRSGSPAPAVDRSPFPSTAESPGLGHDFTSVDALFGDDRAHSPFSESGSRGSFGPEIPASMMSSTVTREVSAISARR